MPMHAHVVKREGAFGEGAVKEPFKQIDIYIRERFVLLSV
jgi:hypothetical protein